MKNKNHLFMLEKFKGFVFGFVFAAALVAVGVYAANTDTLQKKWKAVWHGTDWIDAGRVVRSEELAENLEWLKQQVDNIRTSTSSYVYLSDEIAVNNFPDALNCDDYRNGGGNVIYYLLGVWNNWYGHKAVVYGLTGHNRHTYLGYDINGNFILNSINSGCTNKTIQQLIDEGRAFKIPVIKMQ